MLLDFNLNIACPTGYHPLPEYVKAAGERVRFFNTALEAAKNADLCVTDVWASMGQEEEQKQREIAFKDYQINAGVMNAAHNDALFMHCLPAHRGEEVTAEVIDGPQSLSSLRLKTACMRKKHYWNFSCAKNNVKSTSSDD